MAVSKNAWNALTSFGNALAALAEGDDTAAQKHWEKSKSSASAAIKGVEGNVREFAKDPEGAVNTGLNSLNETGESLQTSAEEKLTGIKVSKYAEKFDAATQNEDVGEMLKYGALRLLEKIGERIQYGAIAVARKAVPLLNKMGANLNKPKQIQFSRPPVVESQPSQRNDSSGMPSQQSSSSTPDKVKKEAQKRRGGSKLTRLLRGGSKLPRLLKTKSRGLGHSKVGSNNSGLRSRKTNSR